MHAPQVVILEADGWIARHLADIAEESAWLVRGARGVDTALSLARERLPCVLLVQVELAADKPAPLRLIAEAAHAHPNIAVVAVSDVKLPDADRIAWTAALFDLGARYVLFPPLTGPVLEDVVSGLMTAAIRRTIAAPGAPQTTSRKARTKPRRTRTEEVIDLADEELHE